MQTTIYSAEDEQELMARLWAPQIKDNPLAFVLYTFPWGQPGTPLEHFSGPRKWQREVLTLIADHIRANNGKVDFDTLRIGKVPARYAIGGCLVGSLFGMRVLTRLLDHHRVG